MDYASFKQLKKKPSGMKSELATNMPLDFGQDSPSLIALLDDFSSFDDIQEVGIKTSWAEDFRKVFPTFEAIACADFDGVENPDSYSEFLLLVDTAQPNAPVYYFSAESWDWDDWEEKPEKGFKEVSSSFAEFHASLSEG